MKRIEASRRNPVTRGAQKLFLRGCSNPKVLEIIYLLGEIIMFTYVVSSAALAPSEMFASFCSTYVLLALAAALLIRLACDATITRLIYLPCLICNQGLGYPFQVQMAVWILLALNVIIDVLSHVEFEFRTQNPNAESFNANKILHYFTFVSATVLRLQSGGFFGSQLAWIGQVICLVLFLLLTGLKIYSSCNDADYKQMLLRFYLLCTAYYTRNIFAIWVTGVPSSYQHLIVIVMSQLAYQLVHYKFGTLEVDSQISHNNICHLVYQIMAYEYGPTYDQKIELAISDLTPERISASKTGANKKYLQEELPHTILNHYIEENDRQKTHKNLFIQQIEGGSKQLTKIGTACEDLLKEAYDQKTDTLFRCLFLTAQIKFCVYNNLVIAKKMLEGIKNQTSWFRWIERLCIYRFEEKILLEIQRKYDINQSNHFLEFLENEKFRSMVVRHSYEYLSLWKYLSTSDFLFKKLTKMLGRILQHREKIDDLYQKMKVKCSTTILLFMEYLYMVRRDVIQTLKVSRSFEIYEEAHYLLQVENKIYVCIGIENSLLVFQNVSFNVKKLLGYSKSAIRNANINVLLPEFFAEAHSKLVSNELYQNNEGLFLMRKNVIIKHFDGYYVPGTVEVKLVHTNEGELVMEGYIEVLQNEAYNWANYFIVKNDMGQLIEVGPTLQNIINLGPKKQVNVGEYFTDKSESGIMDGADNAKKENKKYFQNNGIEYEYDLQKQLSTGETKYGYYVCKNNLIDMPSEMNMNFRPDKKDEPQNYHKYPVRFQDFETNLEQYFTEKNKLIEKINNKAPLTIFLLMLFLLAAGASMQVVLINRVSVVREKNVEITTDMFNLVEFYHSLQHMGMIVNSAAVQQNLGVTYKYEYYDTPKMALSLQAMNEKLTKFDLQKYGDPQSPYVINYPKPLRSLIIDFISSFYMSWYLPDPQVLYLSLLNCHTAFQFIFGEGLDDYLEVFTNKIIQFSNEDSRIKLALSICIILFLVAIYFLMFRVDGYERDYEYECLELLARVNATPIFVNSVTQFLRRVTGGANEKEMDRDTNSMLNKTSFNNTFLNKNQLSSNISARENSVRGFFEEEVISSTNREHRNAQQTTSIPLNTLEMKEKVEHDESLRKDQKIRPRSKVFVLLWTLLIALCISICLKSMIEDQSGSQVSLPTSIEGLLSILRKQITFSSAIVAYFDQIAYGSQSELFTQNLKKYASIENSQISFEEAGYPEFANFTKRFQQLTYVYVCEFMTCKDTYKDYMNIIYYSANHKLALYMQANLSPQPVKNNAYEIRALWYSHYILELVIYRLLNSYLSDYDNFELVKTANFYVFYYTELAIMSVCLLVALYLYVHVFRRYRKTFLGMLDLVRADSYLLKEQDTL